MILPQTRPSWVDLSVGMISEDFVDHLCHIYLESSWKLWFLSQKYTKHW